MNHKKIMLQHIDLVGLIKTKSLDCIADEFGMSRTEIHRECNRQMAEKSFKLQPIEPYDEFKDLTLGKGWAWMKSEERAFLQMIK